VFSKPIVKNLLSQYALVQLYTDVVPARYQPTTTAEENKEFKIKQFGDAQLPLYVILRPQGNGEFQVVDKYLEGKINDVDGFVGFLKKPLAGLQGEITARAAPPKGRALP
jgi:hypothetical protein